MLTPLEVEALGLSVRVAVLAVVLSLPFGVALGWVLGRLTFPGKALLDGLVHLPLVLPPVVVGYGMPSGCRSPFPGGARSWRRRWSPFR
jgi:molybdate transport system permease protein